MQCERGAFDPSTLSISLGIQISDAMHILGSN